VLPQVRAVLGIPAGRGLVDERDLGLVRDPERDLQPSPLAARLSGRPPVDEFG
jgi:hypothetical protein